MAPYEPYPDEVASASQFQPEEYDRPGIIKFINGLPRYGFPRDISAMLTVNEEHDDRSGYVRGIAISSCCLLLFFILWSLVLFFLKLYTTSWASGYIERPIEPEICIDDESHGRRKRRGSDATDDGEDYRDDDYSDEGDGLRDRREEDDGTSSTQSSSSGDHHNNHRSNADELSISSYIFWEASNGYNPEEELTMAVIAREQKRDESLSSAKRKRPGDFSTTTNGKITLVTMRIEDNNASRSRGSRGESQGEGLYRVYIPPSLRLKLLRTYHDCLVHPDEVSNPESMIYEFFTWKGIRRDAKRYVKKYRETMEQGENAALVMYGSDEESGANDDNNDNTPITLDVIAREQKADDALTQMMTRAPSVFSTATNGSIQLITARGKDKKYRIVIPTSLQAKVLKTYHDCLVNPTAENNFEKVLYVHFTWNGIHKDVEDYVENEGLTEEMKMRAKGGGRGGGRKKSKTKNEGRGKSRQSSSPMDYSAYSDDESGGERGNRRGDDHIDTGVSVQSLDDDQESVASASNDAKPIGLDEIAKEQKKDKELRQLKKEEPFVFSTVRYGNTLLTTAQNFRDNKYRIVIPRSLQGRMLLTYKECLLNPTPDRNFDTLLYNHFTWNGIHDDVDYFVKSNGRIPKKEDDTSELSEWIPLVKKGKKSSSRGKKKRQDRRNDAVRIDDPEYAQWQVENYLFDRKLRRIRIAFLLSGLCMIISSIIFFEMGVNKFFQSLNDVQVSLQYVDDVSKKVLSVTGDYLEAQAGIQSQAKEIGTFESTEWCPASQVTDNYPQQVRNSTYNIGISLRDAALRIETEVNDIENDVEAVLTQISVADEKLDEFKTYINIAKVIVIFIDIIVLSLMISCVMAWMEKHHFLSIVVRNTIIIPTFIVLLLIFWVFTTVSLLGAMAGADFCFSPDETALAVILRNQDKMSSVFFTFLVYYVTGCVPERLPPKLDVLTTALADVGNTVHNQINNVSLAIQQSDLFAKCGGKGGPSKLVSLLEISDSAIHTIYNVLFGVREILECQNFNPIYTSLVYDAVCISGVNGLSWIFFTSLSMAVFSMIMVTLRVAIYEY
mmetsp:Transcript_18686/g.38807  ORF Transcript_18686/g.38807 Transcript_18686/m.38807 type:complete len:1066 (-) Transcript_18686:114-3311(-)